jgi:hypothetical protein
MLQIHFIQGWFSRNPFDGEPYKAVRAIIIDTSIQISKHVLDTSFAKACI